MRLESSTEIDASASRVWAIISEVERWPEIVETVTSVEALTPGPLATGSRYRVVQPGLRPATWSVTGYVRGQSFRWVAPNPGVTTTGGHVVTALGEDRARLELSIEHRGPLAWFAGLLARGLTQRYLAAECTGVKRAAEG